jgi:dihydrofolate reductase
MKLSVFIATSSDGYIASENGGVKWLDTAGNPEADMGQQSDMGFNDFMESIDCMIMGRKTMVKLSSFDLSVEQWPYGNTRIIALSNRIKQAPENLHGNVEMYSGNLEELISQLEAQGHKHAYIDGGSTITAFLNLGLITDMIITRAPILLGSGIPLFGDLDAQILLNSAEVVAYPNDFISTKYKVMYSQNKPVPG